MIGKPEEIARWLWSQDRETLFEIKPYREKRSRNANSYAWALMGQIADALRTDKDSVYLTMLKRYGQSEMVSVRSDIDVRGFFKYYEFAGASRLNGKEFTHYRVFKGSSEYDTREMAVLIDGIVSEAQEMEIETLTPQELQFLKDEWRNE